jgi:tetratricopeptide (TPR) repeat protein
MTFGNKPKLGKTISRSAMSAALAFGMVAGSAMLTEPALAQKKEKQKGGKLTPAFQQAAAPLQQAIEAAKTRADVVAAKGNPAALGAALGSEKGMLDQSAAAASTPDDKLALGQLTYQLGTVAEDVAMQRKGLSGMLESGALNPADAPKLQVALGQISASQKDYAGAATAYKAAIDAGYTDNDIEALLAEAYIKGNQIPQGLATLKQAMQKKQAAGQPVPASWYRVGLSAAYSSKQLNEAVELSRGLVQADPTPQNWAAAIAVVRDVGKFPAQETLDLMRLMGRTNSYAEGRDYVEYIQAADPRRLPGESLKVIEAGLAAGKLQSGDVFVSEARTTANGRLAADRASLPSLERDARAANATGATVSGAADALLSYGEPAKAEELYTIALGKPGVDAARVQTRLGIAQVDQGKYAAAQQTLAKVTGPRQPIAQLWSVYATQKGGGGQPQAAAQPAS